MATLDGTSTFAEVLTEYKTTVSYAETNDLALAKRFVTAASMLLVMRASRARNGQQTLEFNSDVVQAELKVARRFVFSKQKTASVIHPSMNNFRT